MSTLSSHVLDATIGIPAVGLGMALSIGASGPGDRLATARTDTDGRVSFDLDLQPGDYRLLLETGPWFAAAERPTFFPEITVSFVVAPSQQHHHVAVLLSPFSYTAYRGS